MFIDKISLGSKINLALNLNEYCTLKVSYLRWLWINKKAKIENQSCTIFLCRICYVLKQLHTIIIFYLNNIIWWVDVHCPGKKKWKWILLIVRLIYFANSLLESWWKWACSNSYTMSMTAFSPLLMNEFCSRVCLKVTDFL